MTKWIAENFFQMLPYATTIVGGIFTWIFRRKNENLKTRITELEVSRGKVELEESTYNLQKVIAKDNAEAYIEAKKEAQVTLTEFKAEMEIAIAEAKAEAKIEIDKLKAENSKLDVLLAEAKQMVNTHERFIAKQRKYTNYLEGLLTENNIMFTRDEIR